MYEIAFEDMKTFCRVGAKHLIDGVQMGFIIDAITILTEVLFILRAVTSHRIFLNNTVININSVLESVIFLLCVG